MSYKPCAFRDFGGICFAAQGGESWALSSSNEAVATVLTLIDSCPADAPIDLAAKILHAMNTPQQNYDVIEASYALQRSEAAVHTSFSLIATCGQLHRCSRPS